MLFFKQYQRLAAFQRKRPVYRNRKCIKTSLDVKKNMQSLPHIKNLVKHNIKFEKNGMYEMSSIQSYEIMTVFSTALRCLSDPSPIIGYACH